ncbi:hypothetical protein [Parabacteroides sp. AM08-6]|uniref:hypothetical protein n=1 Tax=Parabacteroides sp. AM08-6 TaxID=2292053 RepID=UPI000F00B02D|nr:hypothetical protein [Parabacteroides sp. AM08-6]RHJ81518.1 hypothetical protein DW103_11140 [Parabacteroides sp. AM08-6]
MNDQELKNKERMALELNIVFDEAVELFSEESLNTMRMGKVVGGNLLDDNGYCPGAKNGICINFSKCNCPQDNKPCTNPKAAICILASVELPTVPVPTLAVPEVTLAQPSIPKP